MTTQPTGQPAPQPAPHAEKLWPAWWIWLSAWLVGASVSLVFFPVDVGVGILALLIGLALVSAGLLATTPKVRVTADGLQVGRARIDRDHIGRVVAHRGPAAREQLGPGFDATAYQCIRGWIDAVVTVEIVDERDATPYWIFSTRRPEAVLRALGSDQPVRESRTSVQD